jgi:hypothetical protein
MIIAIDPGTHKSAWVRLDEDSTLLEFGYDDNYELLSKLPELDADAIAIEMIASYGMPVGKEVFETCVWIGRFIERWQDLYTLIPRKTVTKTLCNDPRAKDANVRMELINRYGPGKGTAIGKKSSPGPLYGVSGDVWAALAVGFVALELEEVRTR